MPNKLQELTDKLYQEGLSKGKQEAQEMKALAKREADVILSDAREEAKKIIAQAQKDSQELKSKVENDVKMASTQTISALRQSVENIIITKALSSPVKESLTDAEFVKSLIQTIVKAFNASNPEPLSLNLVLPVAMQEKLKSFVEKDAAKEMGAGLTVSFSKQMAGGFKIGPKDGGFLISFSDGDFEKILADYLRPSTKELLFG